MNNKRLYPPECTKCGTEVTVKQLKHGAGKVHIQEDNHFQPEDIWFEHTFDCKKWKKEFGKVNYE